MSHFSNAARVATASVMLATLTGCGDIGYQTNAASDSISPAQSVPASCACSPAACSCCAGSCSCSCHRSAAASATSGHTTGVHHDPGPQ